MHSLCRPYVRPSSCLSHPNLPIFTTSVHTTDPLSAASPGGVSFDTGAANKPKFGRFSAYKRGTSNSLAEVAFFTEGASHETVVGTAPVRVLSLPKAAWDLLVVQFPQQVGGLAGIMCAWSLVWHCMWNRRIAHPPPLPHARLPQTRIVLENLQRNTEAGAEEALKAAATKKQLTAEQLHVALALATGNDEVLDNVEPFMLADTRGT